MPQISQKSTIHGDCNKNKSQKDLDAFLQILHHWTFLDSFRQWQSQKALWYVWYKTDLQNQEKTYYSLKYFFQQRIKIDY